MLHFRTINKIKVYTISTGMSQTLHIFFMINYKSKISVYYISNDNFYNKLNLVNKLLEQFHTHEEMSVFIKVAYIRAYSLQTS